MGENGIIKISKYLNFDTDRYKFILTWEASEIIYREKFCIRSYSGADDWCHHMICELLDVYCGCSKYNCAINMADHEKAILKLISEGKSEKLIVYIKGLLNDDWGKQVVKAFDCIIENLPNWNK